MNREFKKNFFTCLMAVLLIVSNLIGHKLTNFLDITIGVDFITYPFTFLCTLMLINLGGKKDAYRSILVASIIQLLITISYTLAISLGNQSLMPDGSVYVNALFKVDELNILGSVLAFIVSHCVLIYIYENFKHYGKELYGLVIGLLGSLFVNSVIFLLIILRDYDAIFVINMLLSNVIVDIIMIIIITVLFFILKDKTKDKPIEKVILKSEIKDKSKDIGLDEIMENKKTVKKITKKNTRNSGKKTGNNYQKNTSKKTNTSKKIVKKENK